MFKPFLTVLKNEIYVRKIIRPPEQRVVRSDLTSVHFADFVLYFRVLAPLFYKIPPLSYKIPNERNGILFSQKSSAT